MIDSSGSIKDKNPPDNSYDNWELLKNFLINLVDYFTIGPDETQIGAVVFSNEARLQFSLTSHQNAQSLKAALRTIECIGLTTNTPEAIRIARQQCFDPANGDRPNAQNIAIIVTDGVPHPNDLREPTKRQAEILRSTGARMIAVGITDDVDMDVLRSISSLPQLENQNYFTSASFTALNEISRSIGEEMCPDAIYGET